MWIITSRKPKEDNIQNETISFNNYIWGKINLDLALVDWSEMYETNILWIRNILFFWLCVENIRTKTKTHKSFISHKNYKSETSSQKKSTLTLIKKHGYFKLWKKHWLWGSAQRIYKGEKFCPPKIDNWFATHLIALNFFSSFPTVRNIGILQTKD